MTASFHIYKMSFTTGGLFFHESLAASRLYLKCKDWSFVKKTILEDNLFQARTYKSLERVCREVISRLELLSDKEIEIVAVGNPEEKKYILWIGVCKRYLFIKEFAMEVIREKFLTGQSYLFEEDYFSFYEKKSQWYEKLESLKDSTKRKSRQVMFRILKEAEIIGPDKEIIPVFFSKETAKVLIEDDPQIYMIFPVSDDYFKELIN
ncbi:MAG: DUF1819 family protein [Candidatus Muiribacteriota bacterium]